MAFTSRKNERHFAESEKGAYWKINREGVV
jgi:hypothetical protein